MSLKSSQIANPSLVKKRNVRILKSQSGDLVPFEVDWTRIIFMSVIHLLVIPVFWNFSWPAFFIMIFLHWFTGSVGICLTYHRLLSHRSFSVPAWLEKILTVIGTLSLQGGPLDWVSGHRRHHAYVEDNVKDPYSSSNGFWWSHMGWIFFNNKKTPQSEFHRRYTSDLLKVPFYVWLEKYYAIFQVLLLAGLYCLGEFVFDHLGLSFVFYCFILRIVIVWHCTWLINSACHKWGYRTFKNSKDHAKNLWWANLLTYGEGWHNNHHVWAKCAKTTYRWWEIDGTWILIWTLRRLGLARNVALRKD